MLKIGWAEEDITPEKRIALAGQFAERVSEYVETPVTVTALAVESEGEQMIICSCDLVSIGENLVRDVRKSIEKENEEIDTDKIIISAIHTHSSHVYDRDDSSRSSANIEYKRTLNSFLPEEKQYQVKVSAKGDDFMYSDEALLFLTEKISLAIINAWNNRKSAKYATGFGRAAIGMCRRVCYSDGSAKMWGDTNTATFTELEGGNDSGIEMLFFYDDNEKLTGVVANVACPAQVLYRKAYLTSEKLLMNMESVQSTI